MRLTAGSHRSRRREISSWVAAVLFAIQIGVSLGATAATAGEFDDVRAGGVLRVVAYPDPLNEFVRLGDGGDYDGLDIQLLDAFADSIGVRLEVVPIERFEDLFPVLLDGKGDVVAGSITITEEREATVDFTESYFPVLVSVIVREGTSLSDVAGLAGLTASGGLGTSHEQVLQGFEDVRIDYVETTEEMYSAVAEGRVDFTIDDTTTALTVLPLYPSLRMAFELPEVHHFGFAVPPGSDLKEALDEFLATAAKGESYYRLVLRYLGPSGVETLRMVRDSN